MNVKLLPLLGALAIAAPLAVQAGPFVGIGINLGVPAPVVVREGPPPAYAEVVTASPGPGYLWIAGHYTWHRRHWEWVRGFWAYPPQPGAYWIAGQMDPSSHTWIEAHWEVAQAGPPPPPPGAVVEGAPPGGEVIVAAAPPPPPQPDVYVAAPGPGFVWIAGYWGWNGHRQFWYRGHWERPPHGHHAWVAARWEYRNGHNVFIRGYWR